MFYEKPFIDLNDLGIDGVFPGKDADAVIEIVKGFEKSLLYCRDALEVAVADTVACYKSGLDADS